MQRLHARMGQTQTHDDDEEEEETKEHTTTGTTTATTIDRRIEGRLTGSPLWTVVSALLDMVEDSLSLISLKKE